MHRHTTLAVAAALTVAGCTQAPATGTTPVRADLEVAASAEPAIADPPASIDTTNSETVDGAAVELAIRYVASTDGLMAHSPIGRHQILSELVAPDRLAEHERQVTVGLDAIEAKIGRPVTQLVWVEAPISATIELAADGGVRVAVWSVSVFAHPDAGLVDQVWRTTHVTLTRDTGRWWVTKATSESGPTPTANELALPSTVAEFETVAAWSPTVAGVSP